MPSHLLDNLLQKQLTRKEFLGLGVLAVASLFGIVGLIRELNSQAATLTTATEPEDGTITPPATKVTDATASGGEAVKFGAASSFVEFTPGSVKPVGMYDVGTRNVGPRIAESAMEVINGDVTLTSTTHLAGKIIYGQVTGRGGSLTDCIIRGRNKPTSQQPMAVGQSYNFGGTVFTWCRIDGTGRESGFMDCINGGNYTIRYSELYRGVDGVGMNTVGGATVECCRIADSYYMSWWNDATNSVRTTSFTDAGGNVFSPPFPTHSSGDTHNDGVQIQGWSGWVVRGCYIGGARTTSASSGKLDPTLAADYSVVEALDAGKDYVTSAIMINAVEANPVGALIEQNWLQGGAARVNMSTAGADLLAGVTVRNNRFIRSNWGGGGGYYVYAYANHQANLANNVFDDDGTPVPIVLH
jgi:hypothetical protein